MEAKQAEGDEDGGATPVGPPMGRTRRMRGDFSGLPHGAHRP